MHDKLGLKRRAAAALTDEEVREIRIQCGNGTMSRLTASQVYGVGKVTIDKIMRGETYAWVKAVPDALEVKMPVGEAHANALLSSLLRIQEERGGVKVPPPQNPLEE